VCWDQGGVAGGEDCLDDTGEHDLVSDVFDFVDKRGNDTASNDPDRLQGICVILI
jgi:hypothetical protein